ncbi:hypothetical protein PLICRDRAFT_571403 [Plicaturopsis crispa FD-325 SS-3]|nr:hypothetical protein PLICRDRAFT_571403 [Plicaturopsis crispa FD-325 SS-3]
MWTAEVGVAAIVVGEGGRLGGIPARQAACRVRRRWHAYGRPCQRTPRPRPSALLASCTPRVLVAAALAP